MNKEFATIVTKNATAKAGSRILTFTASTKSVDRSGDRVLGPWQLDNFRRNAVLLWAHRYDQLPIAKAKSISVINGDLVCSAEFAGPELSQMADQVFRMYEAGFLRAVNLSGTTLAGSTLSRSICSK